MRARYSALVDISTPLPNLWLLSDERNEHLLEQSLRSWTIQIGFVYRHYHLAPKRRYEVFQRLRRICLAEGHLLILADSGLTASEWGADGIYGAPRGLCPRRRDQLRIATAHNMSELAQANRMGADAVMLSPVFPTRSHPGAATLGPMRFLMMAKHSHIPVIALGGMDRLYSQQLRWKRWAAIDGLSTGHPRPDA